MLSLASIAWWMPSRHLRPSPSRPVNSSTITISPSRTTYSRSSVIVAGDLDRPLRVLVQIDQADGPEEFRLGQRPQQLPAGRGQFDLLVVVVVFVVLVLFEAVGELGGPAVRGHDLLAGFVAQRGDDQRRAGFVDQHAVGLVDHGEVSSALHGLFAGQRPSARCCLRPGNRPAVRPMRRSSSRSRRKSKPNSLAVP